MDEPVCETDVELMRGIAAGQEKSLSELIGRYSGSVLALCQRMLHDAHDADDVAAEVFVEIWSRKDRYDPERASPQTYIFLMARSRCLDRIRAHTSDVANASPEFVSEDLLVGREMSPAQQIAANDLSQLVNELVTQLPEAQRTTLDLAFFEGLTHSQVSEKLKMPLGSVKTHIRKGLLALKQTLKSSLQGRD